MSDGKVFTPATKVLIVRFLFSLLSKKLKIPWWLRKIAKKGLGMIVELCDKNADKIVPDKLDPMINRAIALTDQKDYPGAKMEAVKAFNEIVKIKGINDGNKLNWLISGIRLLTKTIIHDANKKK